MQHYYPYRVACDKKQKLIEKLLKVYTLYATQSREISSLVNSAQDNVKKNFTSKF